MSKHLYAIHDWSDAWGALIVNASVTAWAVISEGIGDNPDDRNGNDYASLAQFDVTPIVRLNYSHHGEGTLPLPSRYSAFAQRCANFVQASNGCQRWIVGNEPNLKGERPDGVAITPEQYANAYASCRSAIKSRDSHHEVIVGAVAMYNVDSGSWMDYWRAMLLGIEKQGGADALALHCYARGPFPHDVVSDVKMDAPYQKYFNGFRAYRDLLAAVPSSMRNLPVYITETDQTGMCRNETTGWVQAAYEEINNWNQGEANQKISCLALYRWENYDQWGFRDKPGVIEDFRAALTHRYESSNIPDVPSAPSTPTKSTMPTQISEDFKKRVPNFVAASPQPGQRFYELIRAEYVPDGARRFGPDHHILVDVLDQSGKRAMGVSVNFYWNGGAAKPVVINKVSEPYGADFGMTNAGHSFGVWVGSSRQMSDDVFGMGLGTIEQPDWGHHVTYYLVFQETIAPSNTVHVPSISTGMKRTPVTAFVVVTDGANLRKAPRTDADIIKALPFGREVKILDADEKIGWSNVQADDLSGWVYSELLGLQRPSGPQGPTSTVPMLVHPVADPAQRRVTQRFGARPEVYSKYTIAGVPLRGHEGIDFGTPVGSWIVAVDDGMVAESADQGDKGYGKYVHLVHDWGETTYAHLSVRSVSVGEYVEAGEKIGQSGWSGNVEPKGPLGAHLHFGLRKNPFQRNDGWGGYIDPAPFLQNVQAVPIKPDVLQDKEGIVKLICAAALEFEVDEDLLLSQAWAESSYNPAIVSKKGAKGLLQIMPNTWNEWAPKIDAGDDPFNAKQNARVGARYMQWLLRQVGGNEYDALVAYGWGIGNWLESSGHTDNAPDDWILYAEKIIHGRDLLKAIGW